MKRNLLKNNGVQSLLASLVCIVLVAKRKKSTW